MLKSCFLVFSALVIFMVSVGLPIYTHTCQEEGTFYAAGFNWHQNHCQTKNAELPICCQKQKKGCCSQEVFIIKYQGDFDSFVCEAFNFNWMPRIVTVNFFKCMPSAFAEVKAHLNYKEPPPLTKFAHQLLTFIGVFRI